MTREAPYLYVDAAGDYNVFVPAAQRNSAGTTWASGPTPGSSDPDRRVLRRAADATTCRRSTTRSPAGQNLLFTPGVYQLDQTIKVKRADTVVLGLGFPTLDPDRTAIVPMTVADVAGRR